MPEITLKPVNIDILFRHKIYSLLVYNMFYSQFDTDLAPIAWTICMVSWKGGQKVLKLVFSWSKSPIYVLQRNSKKYQQMMSNAFFVDQAAQAHIYLSVYVCVDNYGSRCYKTQIESTKNPGFHTFFEILGISLEIPTSNSRREKPSISKFLLRNT